MSVRIALIVLLILAGAASASAEKRVALIIGNGAYARVGTLTNPTRDADAIRTLLQSAKFDLVEVHKNVGAAAMRRALSDFSIKVRDADVAVVFYAGHGIEVNGTNYLVPVDATLERDIDVEDETVPLERITQVLEPARRLRLVMLDACRDSPFLRTMKRAVTGRSIGRGLARVDVVTSDTLIGFASRAGSIAADGDGANSPYTTALLKHLATPGLDLRLALGRVRDDVLKLTGNRQEPYVYGSLGGAEVALMPAAPAPALPPSQSMAAAEWAGLDKTSAAELQTFLRRHPASAEADYARARLEALRQPQPAPTPAVTGAPTAAATPLPPVPQPASPAPRPSVPSSQASAAPAERPVQPPSAASTRSIEWTAMPADVAAWKLKKTTRLGGALSETSGDPDRTAVVVVGSRDGSIHVVDGRTGNARVSWRVPGYEAYSAEGVALIANGKRVAFARGGKLDVFDTATKQVVQSFPQRQGYGRGDLVLSRDGTKLYFMRFPTGGAGGSVLEIFSVTPESTLKLERDVQFDTPVHSFDVTANGGYYLLRNYGARTIALFDPAAKRVVWEVVCACTAMFGGNDSLVAFAGRMGPAASDVTQPASVGVIGLKDTSQGLLFHTKVSEEHSILDVSPDGRLFAVGTTNIGQISIFPLTLDASELRPLIVLKDNSRQNVSGGRFVSPGAIITTSGDNAARLWSK